MPRAYIEALLWDDENEAHVGRHIDPEIVEEVVVGQDWVQVRNKRSHPSRYVRLIGRDAGNSMVTVVPEPTSFDGVWRPVTAWWSTKSEASLFNNQRRNPHVK